MGQDATHIIAQVESLPELIRGEFDSWTYSASAGS